MLRVISWIVLLRASATIHESTRNDAKMQLAQVAETTQRKVKREHYSAVPPVAARSSLA